MSYKCPFLNLPLLGTQKFSEVDEGRKRKQQRRLAICWMNGYWRVDFDFKNLLIISNSISIIMINNQVGHIQISYISRKLNMLNQILILPRSPLRTISLDYQKTKHHSFPCDDTWWGRGVLLDPACFESFYQVKTYTKILFECPRNHSEIFK